MNLLVAWKKVLLFGAFGAVGCLAGWLVGEGYLLTEDAVKPAGAGQGPTLISKPVAPTGEAPPLPDDFRKRLEKAGGKTGDIQISLIWFDTNDLDIHCIDPNGAEIYWKPEYRRSRSGGELDVDRNAGCRAPVVEPVENIYWPIGTAPMGDYAVYLNFYQRCPGGPNSSEYRINILYGGERKEFSGTITKEPGTEAGPKKIIHRFRIEPKLELFAPGEFELPPTKSVKVPIAVRRSHFTGPIDVTVENLPEGVIAGKITIPEGNDKGEIELKATGDAKEIKKAIKFVATGGSLSATADSQLSVPKATAQFSLWTTISLGIWTALLAAGLCLALLAGQNKYLGKPLFASGRVPLALVIVGAVAAGFISGSIGQALFYLLISAGAAKLGFLIGWVLLGGLLGWGVSFFIPNLDGKKAALAGVGGGFLGALAFLAMSYLAEWIGRFGGAALLGFCIGLMVAVVEVAFRRAWLEVRFSEREVITVNLGPEPVKVGGDARVCTVWARGAPEVALRYWIRDGKVHCEDVPTRSSSAVSDGDTRSAGSVTVVVRTSSGPLPATSAPPPVPVRSVVPSRPAAAQPPVLPPPLPVAAPPAPAAVAPAKPTQPDYDDGMPMPMGPPPPARSAATSILDVDDAPVARVAPPVAKPAAPVPPKPASPAPKPPVPTAARPAVPPAPASKPVVPPAPKPPTGNASASGPKPGDPDACPTCGRKSPGKPGARYCMVCDKTF